MADCSLIFLTNYRKINEGSVPKMEVTGVKRIFVRSIEKSEVRYTVYYGDGDTKTFSAVANVYGDEDKVKDRNALATFTNVLALVFGN